MSDAYNSTDTDLRTYDHCLPLPHSSTPFTFDVFFSLLIDDAGAIDRFAVVLLVEILLSLSARVLNDREKGEMYVDK